MRETTRVVALVTLATAAAFVLFRGTSGTGRVVTPEDAVPAGSFLAASIDVAALRSSPVIDAVLGADKNRALGTSAVAEACGFDPLARVGQATLSVPEEANDKGEFGLAARIEVTDEELRTCVTRLAEKRGGTASTRNNGGFVVLDPPRAPGPSRAKPEIAYGHGGLLLVGQGAWLEAMIAAADGRAPSLRTEPAHASLRTSLAGEEAWRKPVLLATMVLPKSFRDRLRAEMADESAASASDEMMRGVLGVSAAGVAVRAVASTNRLEARADLVCDDEPACAAVEKLLLKKRLDWSKDIALRVVGIGTLVDSVELERTGARIRIRASADAQSLAATLNRVLRLSGGAPK